jgi:hypothetical protein
MENTETKRMNAKAGHGFGGSLADSMEVDEVDSV